MTLNILLLHWGTRGGGPQLQARIGSALSELKEVNLSLSFDVVSESMANLEALKVGTLRVGSRGGAKRFRMIRRALSQPWDAVRLVLFCRRQRIDVLYEVMDHPLQLLPKVLLRLTGTLVLGSVHDATRHPGEESQLLDRLATISVRNSHGIMTYSLAVSSNFRERYPACTARIFTTVHGAFGTVGVPRLHPGNDHETVIGFFGRIERYKGLSRLLLAVAELQSRGLRVRAKIDGRGELSPRETELVADTGSILNSGWVVEDQIQNTVNGYDVVALPYEEASQSGVLGFALSSGIPVVGTPVGGLEGQLLESGAGIVARSMSISAFADALQLVIEDSMLYERLSRSGVESARSKFSWDRVASDVVSAARALITEHE